MHIFFPVARAARFIEIELHEADIVEDSRLETVIEFDPAGPAAADEGCK